MFCCRRQQSHRVDGSWYNKAFFFSSFDRISYNSCQFKDAFLEFYENVSYRRVVARAAA